jgi:hypothetical protein
VEEMKPVGWSKRSVQLECERCGAHKRMEFLPYLSAVKAGTPVPCRECGTEEVPADRRRAAAAPTVERRVALPA